LLKKCKKEVGSSKKAAKSKKGPKQNIVDSPAAELQKWVPIWSISSPDWQITDFGTFLRGSGPVLVKMPTKSAFGGGVLKKIPKGAQKVVQN